jgi:O-antigen/teichoic acid export membrane protein
MNSIFNFSFQQRIKLGFNNTVFGLSGTIFNFIFSIVIIKWFSEELWGNFAQMMLLITLMNLVTGWGNKDFLLREFSREPRIISLWQTSIISRSVILILVIPLIITFKADVNPFLLFAWVLINFILRSFDSVIVYDRKFREAIVTEILGFLFIVTTLFVFSEVLTLQILIIIFISASFIKSIIYFAVFKDRLFETFDGNFSKVQLIDCLPYFLPPFIGFLQAKSDTFAVALKLSEKELGEYYILLSLLSYCHATAVLAITPFLKNIYRINSESFVKLKKTFILFGLAWSVICIGIIFMMLTFVYEINFPLYTYLIGWSTLPPYFIYFLLMQEFLRKDNPYPIVYLNLMAAVLNFFISLFLIDLYGFNGGLLSCSIMQWLLLIGFQLSSLKQRVSVL